MPIDYRKYPKNWKKEISPRIQRRDGYRCKFCGIAKGSIGWWVPGGTFYTLDDWASRHISAAHEDALLLKMQKRPNGYKVVLTVAHLDHQLIDHRDENLAALCSWCHLNHDREADTEKRRQGRRYSKKKKQLHFDFLTL